MRRITGPPRDQVRQLWRQIAVNGTPKYGNLDGRLLRYVSIMTKPALPFPDNLRLEIATRLETQNLRCVSGPWGRNKQTYKLEDDQRQYVVRIAQSGDTKAINIRRAVGARTRARKRLDSLNL